MKLAGLLLLLYAALPGAAYEQPPQAGMDIVGDWLVLFSQKDNSFHVMLRFHPDGTVTGAAPHARDFGSWQGKRGEYTMTTEAFTFDKKGTPTGRRKIRATIHIVKPYSFKAEFTLDCLSLDGAVSKPGGTGTALGVAVDAEPE